VIINPGPTQREVEGSHDYTLWYLLYSAGQGRKASLSLTDSQGSNQSLPAIVDLQLLASIWPIWKSHNYFPGKGYPQNSGKEVKYP
jgi:hypothetical protein